MLAIAQYIFVHGIFGNIKEWLFHHVGLKFRNIVVNVKILKIKFNKILHNHNSQFANFLWKTQARKCQHHWGNYHGHWWPCWLFGFLTGRRTRVSCLTFFYRTNHLASLIGRARILRVDFLMPVKSSRVRHINTRPISCPNVSYLICRTIKPSHPWEIRKSVYLKMPLYVQRVDNLLGPCPCAPCPVSATESIVETSEAWSDMELVPCAPLWLKLWAPIAKTIMLTLV